MVLALYVRVDRSAPHVSTFRTAIREGKGRRRRQRPDDPMPDDLSDVEAG